MNVFIDTNILLQLYEASKADLIEFEKLLALSKNSQMSLLVPPQVRSEFLKHREAKIQAALEVIGKMKLTVEVPNLYAGLPSQQELVMGGRELDKTRRKLLEEARDALANDKLAADKATGQLLALTDENWAEASTAIIESARLRVDRGNPPGKKGYGDAINWEWLLNCVKDSEDLHVITDDGDFKSPIDKSRPSQFLAEEWRCRKGGKLYVYATFYEFLEARFPTLLNVESVDKHFAIEALATSPNFASTHSAIARLKRFNSFTSAEKGALLRAIEENDQVFRIITDPDVRAFAVELLGSLADDEHTGWATAVRHHLHPIQEAEEAEEDDECDDDSAPNSGW